MEQSPIVVILLCTLCLPMVLPWGLELPSGSGSVIPSGLELPLGSGSAIPSGSGSAIPSGSGSAIPSGTGSAIPSGTGSAIPSGSGSAIPSGSGSAILSGRGSAIPSGSELPSGSEIPSSSEIPSGLEIPSGSELPSGSGSDSELPSGSGSDSELPLGSELIPLKAVVVVSSTPCSVTCGLGVKNERLCEVDAAGERRNCSLVRSRCLSDWICGLQHLIVPEGKPFQLLCLSPEAASLEGSNFGYTWRFARGLITTNDVLFHPFRNPSPSLSFSPALESHSGTYRCDVQVLSSFQLVKRIYFGLRVIPRDLVDLNFQNSLTWEQQLAAGGEEPAGNVTGPAEWERRRRLWEQPWFYEAVVGVGSGVIVGILFSLGLCCLGRICRKRAAGKINGT